MLLERLVLSSAVLTYTRRVPRSPRRSFLSVAASRRSVAAKKPNLNLKAKPVRAKAAEAESTADRVALWSFVLLVFCVPLAITNVTWLSTAATALTEDQFQTPKLFVTQLFALIGVGAWGWSLLARGGRVRFSPVLWALLALVGWVGLSTVFGVSPAFSLFGQPGRLEGLVGFVTYALVFFLGVQVVSSSVRLRLVAKAIVISATITEIYGVIQYLGLDPLKCRDFVSKGRGRSAPSGTPIRTAGSSRSCCRWAPRSRSRRRRACGGGSRGGAASFCRAWCC